MDATQSLMLLVAGFAIAVPSSMIGVGGGFLIVPLLILVFQLPAQNAVAISLVAIWGTTLSATVAYTRQRRVDFMLALFYDIFDLPGVVIGAYLTTLLPSNLLAGIVGIFILLISMLLLTRKETSVSSKTMERIEIESKTWKRSRIDSSGRLFEYNLRRPSLALVSSFLSGLVVGLAGLGGGIVDTTTMLLLGVPPHVAVASSEFAMALTNGTGIISHGLLNNILIDYALLLTAGTIMGAQVGSSLAKRVRGETLRKVLSILASLVGLRLILLALI
ncbi:MAG: sulfite exporter TauE/SafE family protein [Nitrososphaerales archaeon]|nr:sulfite exporter TauE/SafE family protein [Nitrososphaerales archaeon]